LAKNKKGEHVTLLLFNEITDKFNPSESGSFVPFQSKSKLNNPNLFSLNLDVGIKKHDSLKRTILFIYFKWIH
jgi:hypothetical protein